MSEQSLNPSDEEILTIILAILDDARAQGADGVPDDELNRRAEGRC